MSHEEMMALTAAMPMKTIQINGRDYVQLYYAGTDENGVQTVYHRFLTHDSERNFHSHPWIAESAILCGRYIEEVLAGAVKLVKTYSSGDVNRIKFGTIHRIIAVEPNTWTKLRIQPARLPEWFFINDDGEKTFMKTSPVDWWRDCECRK